MRADTVGYIIGGYDGNDTQTFQIFHAASDWSFEMYLQENDVLAAQFPLPSILLPYLRYSGISVREGVKIAALLMILTEMHEDTVGGPIHLATVSYAEGFNLLHDREVQALVNEVQPILAGIRTSLIDAWFAVGSFPG